jgi:hypothetical protein
MRYPTSLLRLFLLVVLLATLSVRGFCQVVWSSAAGGNDHTYIPVATRSPISWTAAQAAAVAAGGHLATITSAGENAFVFSLIDDPAYWIVGGGASHSNGPWLGGLQVSKANEPAGGWAWITGEAFVFTNWEPSQPDNGANTEDYLTFWSNVFPTRASTWNDNSDNGGTVASYVIEIPTAAAAVAPEPVALALFAMTGIPLAGAMVYRRRQ